eukprot:gb/GEZN01015249.1/.p1 GENE.gb/GEZN01015249.1/~~gb/GEZN01015249.1/.p1  ORF type:complete len:252 (+),score=37.42 gb/GEZN01015249.1/:26-781(+)
MGMNVHKHLSLEQRLKSNSTSSIWARGTLVVPKLSDVISSVSTMLHCQMMRDLSASPEKTKMLPFFQEDNFTGKSIREIPSVKEIYKFLQKIFEVGQFSPECCVISLIYVNRLVGLTGVPLTCGNWKPITVSALGLAQKVWDDTPLINADFSVLYPALKPKDVNDLERKFLDLLEFKLSVSPSLYAQYFFELRSICEEHAHSSRPPYNNQVRNSQRRTHLAEQYQRKKYFYKKTSMTEDELRISGRQRVLN